MGAHFSCNNNSFQSIPKAYGECVMATSNMNENWNSVKSQIEAIWRNTEFDDVELKRARGNLSKMVNLIQQKTGESPMEIRQKMNSII